MAKGASAPTQQEVTTTTSNLPEYARPYFENVVNRAMAQSYQEYQPYGNERIAGFTPAQEQVQQNVLGLQAPNQFAVGSGLTTAAGLKSLNTPSYTPGEFTVPGLGNLGRIRDVNVTPVQAAQMQAAQSGYRPDLTTFQMAAPDKFGQEQLTQYMSPYIQNVVDVQKREALRDARQAQLAQDLGAARQGTYGGSRQLLATMGRERNLGQQLGDIQAKGLQAAFEQAGTQFERDRAAQMEAQRQNLASQISTQQLRTTTDLQVAMANLSNDQQARVQNMAAENQMRGMNAEQALRAALANQQADTAIRAQNLQGAMQTQQLGLEAQRLGEQSRQFGAQQGLAALAQAGQFGQTLGNLGQLQQQSDLSRLQAQQAVAAMPQALEQQRLDQMYADFLRQRDYPMEQLGYFSNILRGLPVGLATTQTAYGQSPSALSQLAGVGLGGLSLYNMGRG